MSFVSLNGCYTGIGTRLIYRKSDYKLVLLCKKEKEKKKKG